MSWPWQENTIQKTIIWPLGQRSRSHEGHYGMWHTALWSFTHIPNIDLSRKKQLFDLEVKGQGPTKVITVCDTPPYDHAPTYQISLTYLERQKCYVPDMKILFKKQLFDLKVKGPGPTKVIMVRDTLPYGHAPTYQISLTYLERNNCLTLRSKVKVPQRSLWYATHRLMVMHPHTNYHWPTSKDKNVMARTRKWYL
jgi:hypothetical protein